MSSEKLNRYIFHFSKRAGRQGFFYFMLSSFFLSNAEKLIPSKFSQLYLILDPKLRRVFVVVVGVHATNCYLLAGWVGAIYILGKCLLMLMGRTTDMYQFVSAFVSTPRACRTSDFESTCT